MFVMKGVHMCSDVCRGVLTNRVAISVAVLEGAEGLERGLLERSGDWRPLALDYWQMAQDAQEAGLWQDILGWASFMAAFGFALVEGS